MLSELRGTRGAHANPSDFPPTRPGRIAETAFVWSIGWGLNEKRQLLETPAIGSNQPPPASV